MSNRYYIRGANAEREAKRILENNWGCEVFRTAGSHSRADLISVMKLKEGGFYTRLIQIKTCKEKDLKRYRKEKEEDVELWIKILNKGWEIII